MDVDEIIDEIEQFAAILAALIGSSEAAGKLRELADDVEQLSAERK